MGFTVQKLVQGGLWITLASVGGGSQINALQCAQFWKSQHPQNVIRLTDNTGNVVATL